MPRSAPSSDPEINRTPDLPVPTPTAPHRSGRFGTGMARRWPWVVVALVAFTGFADIELWPFTGFHLFSHVRTGDTIEWRFEVTDTQGVSRSLGVGDLPPGLRQIRPLVGTQPGLAEPERCAILLNATSAATGRPVAQATVVRQRLTQHRPASPAVRGSSDEVLRCVGP